MTGFFPKIRCLLFGCTFYSDLGHPLNQCRRCGNLPPAMHKIFITCMDELDECLTKIEELEKENKKLKEKLAQKESCEHDWETPEVWPTFSDKNKNPTKVIDVKVCKKCKKIEFENERFV